MLYGYLSYLNNRFYSQLAVDPSDVGLGYATTLARSGGLILVVVLAVGIAQYLLLRGLLGLMGGVFHESPSMFVVGGLLVLLLWFALPVFLYPFTEPTREVDAAVRQAKVGLPVAPVRIYGAVAIMTLRADAAVVEPSGKPGASPATDALRTRKNLLYLGQSNGIAVFFDSNVDRSVYVPADSVVIQLQRPPPRDGRSPVCRLTSSRRWWQWPLPSGLRARLTRGC
jgi:hypothetical protein